MTWTAQLTVTNVVPGTTRGEDGTEVTWSAVSAEVNHDDTWTPYPEAGEHPALTSNTEGKLLAVRVQLVIEGETSLAVGDRLQATGHFAS